MDVFIENLQDKIEVSEEMLDLMKRAVEISLKVEHFDISSEISILLVDNARIREINCEYRNIDKATDVLSFPIVDMHDGIMNSSSGDIDLDENILILGDIIISMEKTGEQAYEYGHSFERELIFLLTHGVFHLLGYDHDTVEREAKMMGRQNEVLENLNLER